MKAVQVGILIALVVVGVLLFKVYTGQKQTVTAPPSETAQPAPATLVEEAPPPVAEARPVKRAPRKPSPVPLVTQPAAEPAAPVETASAPPPEPPAPAAQPAPAEAPAPPPLPPTPQPRTVTIATGTLLSVRLAETLSSDKLKEGETFLATLDRPLVVEGLVVAERGARLEGRVVEAQQAGRVKGVSSLAIQLVRLNTGDGQRVDIQTDPFRKAGETTKGEDATKVGAGAGLGAVIGAIAGGGKGAAIGAAVGGAAGAGTVAATRGKPAVMPVETRIDFRLSRPVTLTERK